MADETTVVLGIPIPSDDPVFLAIVGLHVLRTDEAQRPGRNHTHSAHGNSNSLSWSQIEPSENYDAAVMRAYRLAISFSVAPAVLLAGWAVYRACPNAFAS
jgi:hypothetical protein